MNIHEKFDSIDCRKDDKARRVTNVAPDTVANIDAETLEKGVTLEALETLNVPVFAYGTQVTIHGKLPVFDPSARPGGYKAVFRNGNGSIGVRYSAIDAPKKALLYRACRAQGEWTANQTSQGFEVFRCFYVRDEGERAKAKSDTLAALRTIPVDRFFGSAFAFSLDYGAGYGCAANIGAIPESELWALVGAFTGIPDLTTLEALEAVKKAEEAARRAKWEKDHEEEQAKREAQNIAAWQAIEPDLRPVTVAPESGRVVVRTSGGGYLIAELEKQRGRLFYRLVKDTLGYEHQERKLCKDGFPWRKALAAGLVFIPSNS